MKASMLVALLCLSAGLVMGVNINPNNAAVHYSGRTTSGPNNAVVFDWPDVEVSFYFTGPDCAVVLQDVGAGSSIVKAFLDDKLVHEFSITKTSTTYEIVKGLSTAGPHHVTLYKRTEPLVGVVSFQSIVLADGQSLSDKNVPSNRKIEWIGDSITCGFGILGKAPCDFSPETEDSYWAYESLVSRKFGAEMSVEAWSGKGVVRNCCNVNGTSPDPLPIYYGRSVASYPTDNWGFKWVPNAVVINLGTNDYSSPPQPSEEVFTNGYNNFIAAIRKRYAPASPTFFLACGPMIANPCCSYVEKIAAANKAIYVNLVGLATQPTDIGCDGHPSTILHAKMANATAPLISKYLGWSLP